MSHQVHQMKRLEFENPGKFCTSIYVNAYYPDSGRDSSNLRFIWYFFPPTRVIEPVEANVELSPNTPAKVDEKSLSLVEQEDAKAQECE